MFFNQTKFKASVILAGKTLKDVAKFIGINEATLHRKIARNGDFTRAEIAKIVDFLHLETPQEIFFAN